LKKAMFTLSFYLKPNPPFRLDLTVWVLRRRPHNLIDQWDGRIYTRILILNQNPVRIEVSQPGKERIRIYARTQERISPSRLKPLVIAAIEKMLGIRQDLGRVYASARRHNTLEPLSARFMGVKPPRFPSIFEALINAVACQQVSLHVCIELLNRLAKRYGRSWTGQDESLHAFPLPKDLATADPLALRNLGFSMNKARTIIALARESTRNDAEFENLAGLSDQEAIEHLQLHKGIGRWSAEYVLLRGLGRLNIFPGEDAGAQRSLQLLLGLKEKPGINGIKTLTLPWHPYAGFWYFHFLLAKLQSKGYLIGSLDNDRRHQ
jgi:DNA-3-methyladenine glycosylase II